ncbi:aldose epimerase family protein [Thalassotalea fonticola]|uniref:Aldose 1-epimerase n=1 Tax=Thalassotalea fonticola TaxID=3065649 RepID=A0ABZ0GK82_9GAMM|nr:aldose epimerase family protein [Colwelliaceae bacterium S1-1]
MCQLQEFELKNSQGTQVKIINLGARLVEFIVPTKKYGQINTILGYDKPEHYLNDSMYHGAIAGQYCNRISNGNFSLDNQAHHLEINEHPNHLHGGENGFHRKYWDVLEHSDCELKMQLKLKDGENGYPGNTTVTLIYQLKADHTLKIYWTAISDKNTVFNITSHSYFNLSGFDEIKNHYLKIPTGFYTPHNEQQIPTGEIKSTVNTPFDLREFTKLDSIINSEHPEIVCHGGFDHNWAFGNANELKLLAELYSYDTELLLQVHSTLPGLQCYTGNQLALSGIHGAHEGVCLEPQYYPDSPNQTNFPKCTLKANQPMTHEINLTFKEITK